MSKIAVLVCAVCGAEAAADAHHCEACGEASWVGVAGAAAEPPEPPVDADGLRLDGPTPSEWVAAGYDAKNYPPHGYAAKEDPAPAPPVEVVKAIEEAGENVVPPAPEGEGGPSVDVPHDTEVVAPPHVEETMPPTEPAPPSEENKTTASPEGVAEQKETES